MLSPLDGIPLNGAFEAVLLGVALPALVWLNPVGLRQPLVRLAIVSLLVLKAVALAAVPQQGLCARFTTTAPFGGVISTIDIDEPAGLLRSWDVRADWRSASPRCTAIFDRPYASRERFPIWFVNLLQALRPDGDVAIAIDGYVNVSQSGTFSIERGADLAIAGSIGGVPMSVAGTVLSAEVPAGSHRLQLHGSGRGPDWQFIPRWNGRDAYSAARLTTSAQSAVGTTIARPLSMLMTLSVAMLLLALATGAATNRQFVGPGAGFGLLAALVVSALAFSGRFERFAPLLLVGGAMVPVRRHQQSMRIAFVLLGIPWLTFFVVRSLPQLETVTTYSLGDDWHMYQSAAYSIFLNGQWLRGGSDVFLFQPLYRWTVGALHIVFGDPSVGETYLDAASLLASALLGFTLVKPVAGFRAAIAASALILATFTIGPIWYLIGRGLSEIAGLGWMSLAVMFLLRARLGRSRSAALAGAFAVLMFLTRLNHLLLTGFLLAALLPLRAPAAIAQLSAAFARVRVRTAAAYATIVVVGILLYSGSDVVVLRALQRDLRNEFRCPANRFASINRPLAFGVDEDRGGVSGSSVDAGTAGARSAGCAAGGGRGVVGSRVVAAAMGESTASRTRASDFRDARRIVRRSYARISGQDVGSRRAVRRGDVGVCRGEADTGREFGNAQGALNDG